MVLIEDGEWLHGGKLRHLGKRNILELAEEVRGKTNEYVDSNGVSIVRKSMIQAGLSKDYDGVWRAHQLRNELQDIIAAYPSNFQGEIPIPPGH